MDPRHGADRTSTLARVRRWTASAKRLFFSHAILPAALVLTAVLMVYTDALSRWNNPLYDTLLTTWRRPAWDGALIVAIDEKSLETLGRWPWPRRTHAALLERLTEAGAGVVGLNLVFAEADARDPEGDTLLAQAMRAHGRVVLPVLNEQTHTGGLLVETLPLPVLAQAAHALGHVDVEVDDDGVARRVYLMAGMGTPRWPAFSLAMLRAGDPEIADPPPGERRPPGAASSYAWVRDHEVMIPYSGTPGHVPQVSYLDVLSGRVPAAYLRNRYVLVGVTAAGVADTIPTPLRGAAGMPGVEFNAQLLDSLRHKLSLRTLNRNAQMLLTGWLVLLPFLLYPRCPPRWAPAAPLAAMVFTFAGAAAVLRGAQIWFPPAPALLALAISYPLWSWRQLNRAVYFLRTELQRRHAEAFPAPPVPRTTGPALRGIADIWQIVDTLQHEAHHDPLTGLANRTLLWERLQHAFLQARRTGSIVAVIFIDLDRFKTINDGLGHTVGDTLLRAVAARLRNACREQDTVARLGGDEFVIILDLKDTGGITHVTRKILQSLATPIAVEGHEFSVTASLGVSLYPRDGADAHTLIKNADTAMFRAKEQGGNTVQFYAQEMNARARERLLLEEDLRHALQEGEFELHYQPQMDLRSGAITGLEALLRWRHPRRGVITPDHFIPLAEETGLIIPIGEWTIRRVCEQLELWRHGNAAPPRVALNLSPRQFQHEGLMAHVKHALRDTGATADSLLIEITESTIMKDVEGAIATMHALKDMGLELAIDDFGTGYSSLSYLKRFPIGQLKIDRSFVRDVTTDPGDAAIARAIIAMAHSLNRRVVAEGVENARQLEFLKTRHCDEIQGYYISPPLSAPVLAQRLRKEGFAPVV